MKIFLGVTNAPFRGFCYIKIKPMDSKAAPAQPAPQAAPGISKGPFRLASRPGGRRVRVFLLAWLIGGLWTPLAIAESPDSPNPAALLLAEVNRARTAAAAAPLAAEARLAEAALAQARHLAATGELSHLGPAGGKLGVRLSAVGYRFSVTAENLASGPADAARIVALWRDSPGHRRNMFDDRFSQAGIGHVAAKDGNYWVLILARPADW
jgi:uncharacterized protein YkwD